MQLVISIATSTSTSTSASNGSSATTTTTTTTTTSKEDEVKKEGKEASSIKPIEGGVESAANDVAVVEDAAKKETVDKMVKDAR